MLRVLVVLVVITEALVPQGLLSIECLGGNYTNNSTYQRNLNTLLPSLPSAGNGNGYGFYNSSYGENEDKVYAVALCRPFVEPDASCGDCFSFASNNIKLTCPFKKEAIAWYDNCNLRYSDRSIYGTMETQPFYSRWNTQNVSTLDVDGFNHRFIALLERLSGQAAANGPLLKCAVGNATPPGMHQTIYAFLQCTPDLSPQQCSDCLAANLLDVINYFFEKKIGVIIYPSCCIRVQDSVFYEPASIEALLLSANGTTSGSTTTPGGNSVNTATTLGENSGNTTTSGGR